MPRRRFSRRTRRRLRLLRTVLVLAAIVWAVGAWRSSAGGPATVAVAAAPLRPAPTRPAPTKPATTQAATLGPPTTTTASGPHRLGVMTITFLDSHRPGPPRAATPNRALDTVIRYPIAGDPAAPDLTNAPASGGPFPLVAFAHGFDIAPTSYDQLVRTWARAGYVVASPAFPGTVAGPGADESDVPNQVIDLAFVITSVEDLGGPLAGAVDPTKVAVAGHSDGAETVAGLALDSCCVDPRVKASIVMAGAELALPGGHYPGTPHAPTLIVQGDADQMNPPAAAQQLFVDVTGPKWYVDLIGAGHEAPFTDPAPGVAEVTTDFLDWQVKGMAAAGQRFSADGQRDRGLTIVGQGH